jgi:hypothetical protein
MRRLDEIFPGLKGKSGGDLLPSQYHANKAFYPKVQALVLMSCENFQALFLYELWFPLLGNVSISSDASIFMTAFRALSRAGLFPDVIDSKSKDALRLIKAAHAGVRVGREPAERDATE